jgi:hypothetical protein
VTSAHAGYSATPLQAKLGVRPGARVALLGAPAPVAAQITDAAITRRLGGRFDVIVAFTQTRAQLQRTLPRLLTAREPEKGMLWIAWPKQSSGVPTDLSDGVVRDLLLQTGLVDNKVCVIDQTWSGLRFAARRR